MPADHVLFPDLRTGRPRFYMGGGPLWIPVMRPRMATMLEVLLGGPGQGGDGAMGNGNHYSGKGGDSGGFASLRIAAEYLPEMLYLRLPGRSPGGLGHLTTPTNAAAPASALISVVPGSTAAANIVLEAAAVAPTVAANMWAARGQATWRSAIAGGVQGTNGATGPGAATPSNGLWLTGGGGGCNVYGQTVTSGQITGLGPLPTIPSGGLGGKGRSGVWFQKLLAGTGGSGGGYNNAGTGLRGGDGAPGCGGGGGGCGAGGFAGGDGGWGGPSFCQLLWS